jgi:hypothetical protein
MLYNKGDFIELRNEKLNIFKINISNTRKNISLNGGSVLSINQRGDSYVQIADRR